MPLSSRNVGVTPLSPLVNSYWPMKPAKWLVPEMTVTRPYDRPTPPLNRGLVVDAVRAAQPRRPGAVVAVDEAALAFAAFPFTGKNQRAGIAVHSGVWLGGIELGILIAAGDGRTRELVAHAVVQHELLVHAPVVLRVEAVVRINLLQVPDRFGSACVRPAKQETTRTSCRLPSQSS